MKDDVVLEMHKGRDIRSFGLVKNGKQGHRMRSRLRPACQRVRYPSPWNIPYLHRNFPFGVYSELRQLPLGIESALVVLLQADENLVGNAFKIDRFGSFIGPPGFWPAEDRTESCSASLKRPLDNVFMASEK